MPNQLTSGSIRSAIWTLAWPTILANLLHTAYGFVNMIFVGAVSTESIAAVGYASSLLFLQFSVLMGMSIGTSALVARFVGAGEQTQAETVTRQSLVLAVLASIVTSLPLVFVTPQLLVLLGASPAVAALATPYTQIILLGTPFMFLSLVVIAALRGAGDVTRPLFVMLVQVGLNILGDWLLIFGCGPIPPLGIEGAALATISSRLIALVATWYLLLHSRLRGSLSGTFRPQTEWIKRILRVGIPASFQAFLRTGASIAYYAILGRTPEGTAAIAALTIGLQAESLAFMPGMGFGMAASSMVGQNLGAKQPDRAIQSGWQSARQGALVMGVMGLVFFLLATPFARIFEKNPEVIALATSYLQINALSEPFLGLAMILSGALQGAGKTSTPAWIAFLSLWVLRIPLTWFMAHTLEWGANGAWISMALTTTFMGLLTTAYFRWGRWTETQV